METLSYTKTLLIPERLAWLPYVGLVVTVAVWLGYDFYRFHRKNTQKYARVEEHLTILRAAPKRQRISMISGVGLRFKRGKPVLGDVWNTSPSSSDISVFCSPTRRNGIVAYSREVTSSDDEGEYSETDLFAGSRSESCADLVGNEVHNTHHKGWEIGGEYVTGNLGNLNRNSAAEETEMYIVDPKCKDGEDQIFVIPTSKTSSPSAVTSSTSATACIKDNNHPTGTTVGAAGGGVDDGGGGMCQMSHQDVATQTVFNDFMINVSSENNGGLSSGHSYFFPAPMPYFQTASPRLQRNAEGIQPGSPHYHSEGSPDQSVPFFRNYFTSHQPADARSMDIPTSSMLQKSPGGKSDKKHPQSLRLNLLSAPYSPTSEIVASKHGFAVEGLEVPHIPGGGGRSLPSSGSDIFKPSKSYKQNHSFIKPLNPSPAVTARISSSRAVSPRHSIAQFNNYPPSQHHSHHHRHRRHDSLTVKTPGHPPSKATSPSKRTSQTLPIASRHPRGVSSSSGMTKEQDTSGDAMSLKMFKDDSSHEPPKSAPIPSHFYHQDEEGFFSSINSASHRRTLNNEADDFSNKGILFFSRLAGVGRHNDQGMMGGGRQTYGSFKSGGFES